MAPTVMSILVPTDFSETADVALDYAKRLAGRVGASLHLLHVFTDPYAPALYATDVYVPEIATETRTRAMQDAKAELAARLSPDEHEYFRGTTSMVTGLTATQIAHYAAERGSELIVMGTHGRRGVAHLLLGSVAEQVVRTAPCPVLTVRGPADHAKPSKSGTTAARRAA